MDKDKGFSKQSKEIIAELEDYGWTFRLSENGHAIGRAPDGKTTTSVPKRLSLANRSQQNAEAALKAWRRVVDEAAQASGLRAVVDALREGDDPVIDGVLARAALKHGKEALDLTRSDSEPDYTPEAAAAARVVASRRPWRARVSTSREKSTADEYESGAVVIVTYTDGTTAFECALPGCGWLDANSPRSVAQHYASHVRKGEAESANKEKRVPIAKDVPIDPETIGHREVHTYTPTERLVKALMEALAEAGTSDPMGLAYAALRWMHERPDLPDPETRLSAPLTPEDIIARIRLLVGGRDLALEASHEALLIEAFDLRNDVRRLERECERLADVLSTLGEMAAGEAKRS